MTAAILRDRVLAEERELEQLMHGLESGQLDRTYAIEQIALASDKLDRDFVVLSGLTSGAEALE